MLHAILLVTCRSLESCFHREFLSPAALSTQGSGGGTAWQPHGLPGLNRTMARRQPSSDLSICMSFILDTSSVKTLHLGDTGGQIIRKRVWTARLGAEEFLGWALEIPPVLLCRERQQ